MYNTTPTLTTGVQFVGCTDLGEQYLVTEAARGRFVSNARSLGMTVLMSSPCAGGYCITIGRS